MAVTNISEIFGCNVFGDAAMAERLPTDTYKQLRKTIEQGLPLDREVANVVANAMKDWATEKGATHYTHWFQPLTGVTAEKHDGFITPDGEGRAIMSFSGSALIKGESDASSFPSGGLRATFEARGYTAWDCTSPAFLKEDGNGLTLCIPTVFCSYTGDALDKKTPLLRSMEALNKQALRLLRLMGDGRTAKVTPTVGAEQEYFLVDRDMYKSRLDLILTGRTLFGAPPAKGQEMNDHYFGAIRTKVADFMRELDIELYKLGVYAKTKHNEVAPAQHELACIYEDANLATDHNQIVMEIMRRIAHRYNLECLLSEKPFKGFNGSGKHNNWSMETDLGENLLEPGKTPHENARFLLFLCAAIKAIDEHAALLRASIGSVGNDNRLGGHEAPPSIVSIYIGDELGEILEAIETGAKTSSRKQIEMMVGVSTLPPLSRDTTDRNRTSPLAFTGNKFEFRMVGSSASLAGPNTILNTVVAESLRQIADRLESEKDVAAALHPLLAEIIKKHKRILFSGNGYSQDWVREAERRGLPNLGASIDSFASYVTPSAIEMFKRHSVYSESELYSRLEIRVEKYANMKKIEAETMLDMARTAILPAVSSYVRYLAETVCALKSANMAGETEKALLGRIVPLENDLYAAVDELETMLKTTNGFENAYETARFYRDSVSDAMKRLRGVADSLETLVSGEFWPLERYAGLLFYQ